MPERCIQSYDLERMRDLIGSVIEHGPDSEEFFGQLRLTMAEYHCDVIITCFVMLVAPYFSDPVVWADFQRYMDGWIARYRAEEPIIGWVSG